MIRCGTKIQTQTNPADKERLTQALRNYVKTIRTKMDYVYASWTPPSAQIGNLTGKPNQRPLIADLAKYRLLSWPREKELEKKFTVTNQVKEQIPNGENPPATWFEPEV